MNQSGDGIAILYPQYDTTCPGGVERGTPHPCELQAPASRKLQLEEVWKRSLDKVLLHWKRLSKITSATPRMIVCARSKTTAKIA